MAKSLFLSVLLVRAIVCSGTTLRAQAVPPTEQQITQPIIVNGEQVNGVTIIENGVVQSYTCPYPQQYVTADQSSSGWTCFDETTGTWLTQALPPQSADLYNQPPVVYDSGASVYSYYGYPYSYYPYGYYPFSYWGAPGFAFGFNSGHGFGHGHFEPHGNAHFGGSFGHGSFGHGSFNGGHAGGFAPGGSFGHGGFGGHAGGGGGGHAGGGHR